MDLEALLDEEYENRKKALEKAVQIAKREWENVRVSLALCGDIGEFSEKDFMIGTIEEDVIIREPLISPTKSISGYAPTFYPMYFVRNLLTMDEKFAEHGYKTTEALYVFIELAAKAVERLGLVGTFCMGFGAGYGNVRTGWIAEKGQPLEREIFFQMFFRERKRDYDWDFHWTSVRERLKQIFDKFRSWQNDSKLYHKEVKPKAIVKPMMV
ncbi:MAG: hypothetical protein HYW01_10225 [Deltaproteobacteria bacterium]|nr:hypothetical protein [Deltaproteobacteria bacterium]